MQKISALDLSASEIDFSSSGNLTPIVDINEYCSAAIVARRDISFTIEGQISGLYITELGRDVDDVGLAYWVDQVEKKGKSMVDVQNGLDLCRALRPSGDRRDGGWTMRRPKELQQPLQEESL